MADVVRDREQLFARVVPLLGSGRRVLIGIAGPPGAGKSTLAAWLQARVTERFGADPLLVAQVPMDGFHLSNAVLAERGLRDRKGAPETFDRDGFADLLCRARDAQDEIGAPAYSRELHEPVPDAHRIPASVRLIISEGNYLLLPDDGWDRVGECLDEIWYLDVPWEVTRQRLVDRQVAGGRTPEAAAAWVDGNDKRNTGLVVAAAGRAAVIVSPARR
ncbi:pantothenate kinase [Actinoplanes sp. SE50]|uniref:nucleoside/nucleotide kinase family protein n=1 Tax=unclassified Actinoplanes TaxID=2626549 RepID=UPI00023ED1E6|nr:MULTISPECIES: nucleoside/nucleotide kinase family protein [unclassified Actinoplanes]AEV83306.1 putative fructose transport system kinase [Actinoplanes sp. SE50/110]ATO81699.1 pantothenate kinase [Actinoplanes sp. SE50]SLL99107.1 nucleoside/nucleotide kinase family protein [Actinoplanes sp. SE50/110]